MAGVVPRVVSSAGVVGVAVDHSGARAPVEGRHGPHPRANLRACQLAVHAAPRSHMLALPLALWLLPFADV